MKAQRHIKRHRISSQMGSEMMQRRQYDDESSPNHHHHHHIIASFASASGSKENSRALGEDKSVFFNDKGNGGDKTFETPPTQSRLELLSDCFTKAMKDAVMDHIKCVFLCRSSPVLTRRILPLLYLPDATMSIDGTVYRGQDVSDQAMVMAIDCLTYLLAYH